MIQSVLTQLFDFCRWLVMIAITSAAMQITSYTKLHQRVLSGTGAITDDSGKSKTRTNLFDVPTDVLLLIYDSLHFDDLMRIDKATTNKQLRPRSVCVPAINSFTLPPLTHLYNVTCLLTLKTFHLIILIADYSTPCRACLSSTGGDESFVMPPP
jgi:hypothetical protein